ncbi:cytochrome c3 family protein [Desulfobacterium sp. N47]|uniref:cytochrome c3 family protein n=1 Tax=Desulfobacterium sp. N47 TaxID=3115210 RepID=UPI003F49B76F
MIRARHTQDLTIVYVWAAMAGYTELAKKTEKLDNIKAGITNPHKSHIGEARCTLCHKNHAQSVLDCNQCHLPKFDMKVP